MYFVVSQLRNKDKFLASKHLHIEAARNFRNFVRNRYKVYATILDQSQFEQLRSFKKITISKIIQVKRNQNGNMERNKDREKEMEIPLQKVFAV